MSVVLDVALYLLVLAFAWLLFLAPAYLLGFLRHDELIERFRGRNKRAEELDLDHRFRASEDGVVCHACGATNGASFSYCQYCLEPL